MEIVEFAVSPDVCDGGAFAALSVVTICSVSEALPGEVAEIPVSVPDVDEAAATGASAAIITADPLPAEVFDVESSVVELLPEIAGAWADSMIGASLTSSKIPDDSAVATFATGTGIYALTIAETDR